MINIVVAIYIKKLSNNISLYIHLILLCLSINTSMLNLPVMWFFGGGQNVDHV